MKPKNTTAGLRQARADDKRLGERLKYLVEDMRLRAEQKRKMFNVPGNQEDAADGLLMAAAMLEDFLKKEGEGK